MKMKTSDLTDAALDWAVAKCEGETYEDYRVKDGELHAKFCGAWLSHAYSPSTNGVQGGQIIERENISVIRVDDDYELDSRGFCTRIRIPVWAAVHDEYHSACEQYGRYGDYFGRSYEVDSAAVLGPTPLIAAMRAYVASKLGDEIDVPSDLIGE